MKVILVISTALFWVSSVALHQEPKDAKIFQDGSNPTSEKLFFGKLSTQSHTIVSYTTSTLFFSCFQGLATSISPCTGKKRRRRRRQAFELNPLVASSDNDGFDLDSSVGELKDSENGGEDKDSKRFFTVWTRSITTTTLTTFFTNTDTTISLSYYCTAGNLVTPADGC